MKIETRDNVAKFMYDCGKVCFTILVIGVIVRKPFIFVEFIWGVSMTLGFFLAGYALDELEIKEGTP